MKKFEFSKLIYIFNIVFVVLVVLISFTIVVLSGKLGITDISPISTIIMSAFAELATTSIMYSRKAQAENVLKLSKQIQSDNIEIQNVEIANQVMNSNFNSGI